MPWLQPTSDCISLCVPSLLPSSQTDLFCISNMASFVLTLVLCALPSVWPLSQWLLSSSVTFRDHPRRPPDHEVSPITLIFFRVLIISLYDLHSSCWPSFTGMWALFLFHSLQYLQFLEQGLGHGRSSIHNEWTDEWPMHTAQYIFLWVLYVFYFALKLLCIF